MKNKKIQKKDLNHNIHLSEGNIKSSGTEDTMFLTWSLPSRKACPYKTNECSKRCFARKNETFKAVLASRRRNWDEAEKETFVDDMIQHLEYHLARKKAQDKLIIVRIHTSGDFYSINYLEKWISIANHFKNNKSILLQAYTKSMPFLVAHFYNLNKVDQINFNEILNNNELLLQARNSLNNINIHFVWSEWYDTPREFTSLAKKIGMQVFTALPKPEIDEAVNKECYTGKSNLIIIPWH